MEEVDTGALKELARAVVRQGRESDEDSPGMTQDPVVTILVEYLVLCSSELHIL